MNLFIILFKDEINISNSESFQQTIQWVNMTLNHKHHYSYFIFNYFIS